MLTLHILKSYNFFTLVIARHTRPAYLAAVAYTVAKYTLFWSVVLTVFYVQLVLDLTNYLWNLSYDHTVNLVFGSGYPTWEDKRVLRTGELVDEIIPVVTPVSLANVETFTTAFVEVFTAPSEHESVMDQVYALTWQQLRKVAKAVGIAAKNKTAILAALDEEVTTAHLSTALATI